MNKQEYFNTILENYFAKKKVKIEIIKQMLTSVSPVFGKLEVKIEKTDEGETKLTFVDNDVYNSVVKPDGTIIKEEIDMSAVVAVIYLDENNVVSIIEHGFRIFTPANKEKVLTVTSLIGKTVTL